MTTREQLGDAIERARGDSRHAERARLYSRLCRYDAIEAKTLLVLRGPASGIVDQDEERQQIAALVAAALLDL